ncbi:hypothetical protein Psch_04018 [Pelotomaculum schinkii]|uniref:Uncharacterized protein n=1 Tax=Pelotomaculum schinkii TaxID=78350 RepID=A0A4Y7R6D8_9FIRM|nr:hypothetical protein Psch_04018 [Pelotomaculum schinkii]
MLSDVGAISIAQKLRSSLRDFYKDLFIVHFQQVSVRMNSHLHSQSRLPTLKTFVRYNRLNLNPQQTSCCRLDFFDFFMAFGFHVNSKQRFGP